MNRDLLEKKAGSVASKRLLWERAIQGCKSVGLGGEEVELLSVGLRDASSLEFLVDAISLDLRQQDQCALDSLLTDFRERIDESTFAPKEWGQALESVCSYLKSENRKSTFSKLIGYVDCAGQFIDSKSLALDLKSGVEEFLRDFGFEG